MTRSPSQSNVVRITLTVLGVIAAIVVVTLALVLT
jgi:hypothetical protein